MMGKEIGRRYTDEEKGRWIATLIAAGKDVKKSKRGFDHTVLNVSKLEGAPTKRTLYRWWADRDSFPVPVQEAVEETKRGIHEKLEELANLLLGRALVLTPDETSLRTVVVSLGIVLDKMALLQGQPTSITMDVSRPIARIKAMVENGEITQAEVRARYPHIAKKLWSDGPVN